MGCTHTSGCPLFPKLNASLRGWRDAYCDSTSGWQTCARYRLSLTGQPVPLTLLPNGRDAQALVPAGAADGTRSRFAGRRVVLDAGAGSPFEHLPATRPAAPLVEARPPSPRPRTVTALAVAPEIVRPVLPARAGWWARLVEWMRSPA